MNLSKSDWNALIIACYEKTINLINESKEAWDEEDIVDTRLKAGKSKSYLDLTQKIMVSVERMKSK